MYSYNYWLLIKGSKIQCSGGAAFCLSKEIESHFFSLPNSIYRILALPWEQNAKLASSHLSSWGLGEAICVHTIIHKVCWVVCRALVPPQENLPAPTQSTIGMCTYLNLAEYTWPWKQQLHPRICFLLFYLNLCVCTCTRVHAYVCICAHVHDYKSMCTGICMCMYTHLFICS